jgi:GAF domain-containing protein
MDEPSLNTSSDEAVFAVDNWPMRLDALRSQLKKAQKLLMQYRAALRLARTEIERRNHSVLTLTAFAFQSGSVSSLATLLKLALARALEVTEAPVGAIILIDPDTKELTLGVHKGLTTELTRVLTGHEIGAGAAVLMPHLAAGSGALLEYASTDDKAERALLSAGRMTSLVSMPVQASQQLMGALLIGLQGERRFKPAELRFIMAVAQQTAVAMEGLRLRKELWHTAEALLDGRIVETELHEVDQAELDIELSSLSDLPATAPNIPQAAEEDLEQLLAAMMETESEVRQQNADLRTLNNLAELMNRTLDLREILACTVDQTRSILGTDAAWIYLVEEDDRLVMRAQVGLSPDYVRGMRSLKLGDGLEGRVASENKARFIESLTRNSSTRKIWVEREGLNKLAAVPITRPEPEAQGKQMDSQMLGVLLAANRVEKAHTWSTREKRLMISIANHVALAIDNARLYAQVQQGEAGMRTGNQVLCEINDMLLHRNAFLESLIEGELVPAIIASARLVHVLQTKNLAPFTHTQIESCATALQKAIDQLGTVTREIDNSNIALGATEDESHGDAVEGDDEPKVDAREEITEAGTQLMTLDQAIATGLIPSNMLSKK